jgi:hypothetical protein
MDDGLMRAAFRMKARGMLFVVLLLNFLSAAFSALLQWPEILSDAFAIGGCSVFSLLCVLCYAVRFGNVIVYLVAPLVAMYGAAFGSINVAIHGVFFDSASFAFYLSVVGCLPFVISGYVIEIRGGRESFLQVNRKSGFIDKSGVFNLDRQMHSVSDKKMRIGLNGAFLGLVFVSVIFALFFSTKPIFDLQPKAIFAAFAAIFLYAIISFTLGQSLGRVKLVRTLVADGEVVLRTNYQEWFGEKYPSAAQRIALLFAQA